MGRPFPGQPEADYKRSSRTEIFFLSFHAPQQESKLFQRRHFRRQEFYDDSYRILEHLELETTT